MELQGRNAQYVLAEAQLHCLHCHSGKYIRGSCRYSSSFLTKCYWFPSDAFVTPQRLVCSSSRLIRGEECEGCLKWRNSSQMVCPWFVTIWMSPNTDPLCMGLFSVITHQQRSHKLTHTAAQPWLYSDSIRIRETLTQLEAHYTSVMFSVTP